VVVNLCVEAAARWEFQPCDKSQEQERRFLRRRRESRRAGVRTASTWGPAEVGRDAHHSLEDLFWMEKHAERMLERLKDKK